jgi:GNAT superfamily N-acetyltransferase
VTATLAVAELTPAQRAAGMASLREWLAADGVPVELAGTWPQVYHPLGDARAFGMVDGERLLAHAAVVAVTLVTADGPLPAWFVGSVAIDPTQRRQGLATRLLRDLKARADAGGAAATLLWSRDARLYARAGFAPAGVQHAFTLCVPPDAEPAGVRLAVAGDVPALHRLHREKRLRVERTLGEHALLLSAAPMQTVVREVRGVLTAYACLGKGSDLALHWHEVAGDDAQIARLLLAATAALELDEARVLLPEFRRGVLDRLGPAARDARAEPVALVRWAPGGAPRAFHVDGLDSI